MQNKIVYFEEEFKFNKKTKKHRGKQQKQNTNLQLQSIQPKTKNQRKAFASYVNGNNLLLHGIAGTGKTFISLYLALRELLETNTTKQKIVLVRSVVPTRDMGFLPGNQKEKQKAYELPYYNIFTELFGRGDAYDYLKGRNMVEFISTSFIRGITLNDSIVIVDESQNMDFGELDSIITRVGDNSKIIFCGDYRQCDLERQREKTGIIQFMKILKTLSGIENIEFEEDDIVRSKLVKDYIVAKFDYGIFT
jgi:phosphate starvation-inducible PhoH-like protein/PhoH-like ATPase